MQKEMDSLQQSQNWDLVSLPAGKRELQNKWVYRLKEEEGGKRKYKSRLVVKGFAQKEGIAFNEIFSPVVKMNSIRAILRLVVTSRTNGCKNGIPSWRFGGGDLHAPT